MLALRVIYCAHAELAYTQVGQRVFGVTANGAAALNNFDILQAAGNGSSRPGDIVYPVLKKYMRSVLQEYTSRSLLHLPRYLRSWRRACVLYSNLVLLLIAKEACLHCCIFVPRSTLLRRWAA